MYLASQKTKASVELFVYSMLVVSLQAVAADGQANKMLIKYLAKLLKIQQKKIVIQRGTTSRNKVLCITATLVEQHRIIDLIIPM